MSGADYHFHQYRASTQNTPAHSKPSSRVASPTSSRPASRAPSKPASRRTSRNEDAKAAIKTICTNEWKVPGLYSNSRPSSRSNSRRNSLTEKVNGLVNGDITKQSNANIKNEWKAPGLYSNSRSNSRKNSISDKSTKKLKWLIQNEIHNENLDPEALKTALSMMEWKAPGVYSTPSSAVNSRKNSITERLDGKITRGMEAHMVNGPPDHQEINKESIEKALSSCEWRASGVYSSKPSSRSTSRKNSIDKPLMAAPKEKKEKENLSSKEPNEDPITVFFREKSRPTSRRGSIIEEGSQIPTFPIMSFLK